MTLRVARILGRPNVGGPTRTALLLARQLKSAGMETLLLVGESGPGEGDLLVGVTDVEIRRIPGMVRRPGPADLRVVRRLRRELGEFRPDLVHTHAAKAGAVGRLAARSLVPRPKLVHTFHGHVLDGYFSSLRSSVYRLMERRLARVTDQLLAVSPQVADELAGRHRVASRDAFQVILNGIDLSPYAPADAGSRRAARQRLGVGDESRCLLVPARLVAIKGHDLLLLAVDRLPTSCLPLEVHLLGDGPLRQRLESSCRSPRDGVVYRFHGFRDDLPSVLPAADVVVLPSRKEGLPQALIEAMATGLPVVATAVGGVPDLVESGVGGLLTSPGDPSSLAFAIARILEDLELSRRLGLAGRERAIRLHGAEQMVVAHQELYQRLLAWQPVP